MFTNKAIAKYSRGLSFADVGGLWGTLNERVSVASQAGASELTMVDIVPQGHELWSAFHERMRSCGIKDYSVATGNLDDLSASGFSRTFDMVHCSGIIYHCPNPIHTIASLRSITNKYLILTSMVLCPEVWNERVPNLFSGQSAVLVPTLAGSIREEVADYLDSLELSVHNLNSRDSFCWWWGEGRPNYEPWWWLWTPEFLKRMSSAVGFRVLDEGYEWNQRSYSLLLERCVLG